LIEGSPTALSKRKISEETCAKFGYLKGEDEKGASVQIAPFYNAAGQLIGQKLRYANKKFKVVGTVDEALPFGAHVWQKTGKMIVVTEGELDALSMSQVQGNKWPVVSLVNGSNSAKKLASKQRDYFLGFEKVIVMFDMDEPGRKAALEFAEVIGTRCHIAELPEKDANECLVNGRTSELIDAMWKAKQYRPEGIVALDSLKEKTREKPALGISWPWRGLSELLFGIQQPYIYTIGAATGAGKTDVLRQIITHLVIAHNEQVGVFSLEEEPHTTALGLAAKVAERLLNTPQGWDPDAFDAAWTQLTSGGKVHLYDSFGMNEWETIRDKIEYLHHAEGVRYFVLDHLTALASGSDDDRVRLEFIMRDMSSVVTRLGITIFLVSHLATPEGKPHEEGGRVMIRHMKGSRAIGQWSHGAIGLERNQQAEDPAERHTTTVRILKARGFGWNVGKCTHLKFNEASGMLTETGPSTDGGAFGFPALNSGGESGSPDF
jgi:twinkle protein